MKPIPLGRLIGCGLVLVAISFAIVRLFEAIEADRQQAHARELLLTSEKPRVAESELNEATLWLEKPQGSPVVFWEQLVALAEDARTPAPKQARAKEQLRLHSKARLHELIFRAMAEADGCEEELRAERELYARKRKVIERDIAELKLRYPLADAPRDPNISPEEMQELISYALSYKRDRMVLDSGLERLSEVLAADTQRITMEQNVFRSHAAQLQKFLSDPGYLPIAPPKTWDPALLPPRLRLHLPVTFDALSVRLADLMPHITQLSGVPVELASEVKELKELHISLRIDEQSVSLATNWTARLADLDVIERDNRLILIVPDPKKAPPVVNPTRERPSAPNDAPGDF